MKWRFKHSLSNSIRAHIYYSDLVLAHLSHCVVAGKSMAWHVVRYPASSFGGFYKNKILLELGLMTYLCSNKKERKEKNKVTVYFQTYFLGLIICQCSWATWKNYFGYKYWLDLSDKYLYRSWKKILDVYVIYFYSLKNEPC